VPFDRPSEVADDENTINRADGEILIRTATEGGHEMAVSADRSRPSSPARRHAAALLASQWSNAASIGVLPIAMASDAARDRMQRRRFWE
jgi:hypothetical protein